jgi:hypothetical protein
MFIVTWFIVMIDDGGYDYDDGDADLVVTGQSRWMSK